MTPTIVYIPQWTACGAPFPIIAEIPLVGPLLILALFVCAAALCFIAAAPSHGARTRTRSRARIRVVPRPTALPQRF